MRATYEKANNLILVELTRHEANKYCSNEIEVESLNLQHDGEFYQLTIPCGENFYQMTQRQRGGRQSWGPDELRQAIRAAVANKFVHWNNPDTPEGFRQYKQEWNAVFQSLLRNVRLKFPSNQFSANRLTKEEYEYRRSWRRQHRI
jgi:hypothetical protein